MTNKPIRLDKSVSHAFDLSRKEAFELIKEGLVSVNENIILDPTYKVNISDHISLGEDSTSVQSGFAKRYFMLNKPVDYICADRDRNYATVLDLIHEPKKDTLHCVGRLDIDTTGLLIISDDGDFIHKVTSPKKNIYKTYIATVDKPIPQKAIELFKRGIKHPLEKKRYKSAILQILDEKTAKVIVTEGRFHEVKRLFEYIEINVLALQRVAIGNLQLDDTLSYGEYKLLEQNDIDKIFIDLKE